jgi:N utilization substance protein B
MGIRRVARECAVQMLYQRDIGKHDCEYILNSFWEMNEHSPQVREFATRLFEGSVARLEEIDELIQSHAENWRLSRMAAVDRNILRLAVYELLSEDKTPSTVVINEALEVARKFSIHESAQFVNGILDSIRKHLSSKKAEE